MLGLHRKHLRLEEPDTEWASAFRKEQALIEGALSEITMIVEHIGSTSIPGLPAKPIIDIGILLPRPEDLASLHGSLVSIGYLYRGDKGSEGGHLFVREREPEVRTHHVHVVLEGDPAWDRYLRFRGSLGADPELRSRYALLKQGLERELGDDRAAYRRAKTPFITDVLGGA